MNRVLTNEMMHFRAKVDWIVSHKNISRARKGNPFYTVAHCIGDDGLTYKVVWEGEHYLQKNKTYEFFGYFHHNPNQKIELEFKTTSANEVRPHTPEAPNNLGDLFDQ